MLTLMKLYQLALLGLAALPSVSRSEAVGHFSVLDDEPTHGALLDPAENVDYPFTNFTVQKQPFDLSGNNAADESILEQAFLDLQTLVTYVAGNPNPQVLARYFDPNHANDVNAIFNTVMQMASENPPENPQGPRRYYAPTDLRDLSVVRSNGAFPTLAQAYNVAATNVHQQIKVFNFGWDVLWLRLLQSYKCSMIGPKTNYKMHFLGSLLLHETLHFNNVPILAWNRPLLPEDALDDQPGQYACFTKAYGPNEAIKLRNRSFALAKLNIENYVWYALEIFWMHQCPNSVPSTGMFIAPKNNDIPSACKQGAKGALSNLWCWIS